MHDQKNKKRDRKNKRDAKAEIYSLMNLMSKSCSWQTLHDTRNLACRVRDVRKPKEAMLYLFLSDLTQLKIFLVWK